MLLSLDRVSSGYGPVPVLRQVSFAQAEGEILGVVGHNGMGKTTLLRTVMGLLQVKGGAISLDGQAVERLPAHRRSRAGLGYVPQGGLGFPNLTVAENLRLATARPGCAASMPVDEVVALFPRLAALMQRPSGALSGGERQLLAIGRAVIRYPRLLLLDELTEGVQPSVVEEIVSCLRRLHDRSGMAILLVDQDLAFVGALAGRVLVMQKGCVQREAAPADLADPELLGGFGPA